jgi:phage shock protein PspC (stress-responsive transcriptional regulator)
MHNEIQQEPIDGTAVRTDQTASETGRSAHGWTIIREEETTKDNQQRMNNTNISTSTNGSTYQSPSMLYRHPTQKIVGGVCGGLADFLGWDPVLVRILWVVATIATGGGGFLAYAALWLLLPVGTANGGQQRPAAIELTDRNLRVGAYALMGLGILWLLSNIGILPWLWSGFWNTVGTLFWPALLIGAGFLLLNRQNGKDWRASVRNATSGLRTRMGTKMPSGDEVKDSLKDAKQRIPLKRSRQDRILLGVCGGIGQKLGMDSNLVRLIWAAFSVGSIGMGVLLYVLVGLLLPEEYATSAGAYTDEAQDVEIIEGTAENSTVHI